MSPTNGSEFKAMSDLANIQEEVTNELANPEVFKTLLATTFKGLTQENMKLAIMDGMIRGFTFKDFRERNVYAIPFKSQQGDTYSLVTSIDHALKIAQKSGIVGIDAPVYGEDGFGQWCSVTIKRDANGTIGSFTSKVYFKEYTTGKNLWMSKPLTMLAKVAKMHALRMACPEELAQAYTEEEVEKGDVVAVPKEKPVDVEACNAKLMAATNLDELRTAWDSLTPAEMHNEQVLAMKKSMKRKFELPNVNEDPNVSGK